VKESDFYTLETGGGDTIGTIRSDAIVNNAIHVAVQFDGSMQLS